MSMNVLQMKEKKSKEYSTQYSRVVTHHSTDCAVTSLTSEIGRDPVLSGAYGRIQFCSDVVVLIM